MAGFDPATTGRFWVAAEATDVYLVQDGKVVSWIIHNVDEDREQTLNSMHDSFRAQLRYQLILKGPLTNLTDVRLFSGPGMEKFVGQRGNCFKMGSSKQEVLAAHGTPEGLLSKHWIYGRSDKPTVKSGLSMRHLSGQINFGDNDRVSSWVNREGLKIFK